MSRGQFTKVVGSIFTQIAKHDKYAQVSVPKGIKRRGERALDALLAEYGQIHNHDTFLPQIASKLTQHTTKRSSANHNHDQRKKVW